MAVSTRATRVPTYVPIQTSGRPQAGYVPPMALTAALSLSIGLVTALNGILAPHFRYLFHLSNAMAPELMEKHDYAVSYTPEQEASA